MDLKYTLNTITIVHIREKKGFETHSYTKGRKSYEDGSRYASNDAYKPRRAKD